MGELLAPAIDIGTALFGGGADAAAAVATPAFDVVDSFAPAATQITVGADQFGPALGEGAGLFGGAGGDLAAGAAGAGVGAGLFGGEGGGMPDINVPTFDNVEAPQPGQSGLEAQGGTNINDLAFNKTPVDAPQSFQQAGTAPTGGANPAADPLGAGPKAAAPTPLDQPGGVSGGAAGGSSGVSGGGPAATQNAQPQQPGKSSPGFWDTAQKWAGPAIAAGGLGYNMLQNNKNQVQPTGQTGAQQSALAGQLGQTNQALTAQGSDLASYISKGTLPPAFQTSLDQATNSAITQAISSEAAMGRPTDPIKNTALAQRIDTIKQNAVVQSAQLMQMLASTGTSLIGAGLSQAQLQQQIYDSLIKTDQAQSASTGKAIANFAGSLSSRPQNTVLQLGGTSQAAA